MYRRTSRLEKEDGCNKGTGYPTCLFVCPYVTNGEQQKGFYLYLILRIIR